MAHMTGNIAGGTARGVDAGAARRGAVRGGSRRLRLFCFHHAGGSAWSFAGWGQWLGREVEVVPVSLPPRSAAPAGADGAVSTMDDLVHEVTRQLAPALDEPYAFYGHSMGSLIAYGVAQRRLAEGRRPPACFVAAAHRAPHLPPPDSIVEPSDGATLELLLGLGGAGRLLRENPGRMSAVMQRLRQDLLVSATYRHPVESERPLSCPVHVLHGRGDALVPTAHAAAWNRHAEGTFSLRTMPGGHFFHKEHKELFFEELGWALMQASADLPA
ncbi:thioesterase II family protein [Streptomyces sp. NPDC059010]|uniref:thioesterase II family protein n=1 Tax=Streptomyces sp. NPDC059010 TaxID=3346695 RepID=UPI0036C89CCA